MSNIKMFTHTDLDGVGCAIVAFHIFGENVSVEYCDNHNVNEKISAYLNDAKNNHNEVYITDISVSEELAERIDSDINSDKERTWRLLDHHATADWLNRYSWADVITESGGKKRSAADIFYSNLVQNVDHELELGTFVEKVRSLDTWDWSATNDTVAKGLNDLFWLIGKDRFFERFVANPSIELTESERFLLEIEHGRIEAYKEIKLRQLVVRQIAEYKVGIVFADRYQSELGNFIVTETPELDFVAMIDPGRSVSYRGNDKVDVGLFAKKYGGGGHKNAAGSSISDEIRNGIIDVVFEEVKITE